MVFPKLLGSVLACDSLQDLLATRVLVLKLGQVVDVLVNNDPEVIWLVV